MSKHRPNKFRDGSHLMLCDLSGRTCYAEDMRRMWNGLMVHKDYWEPRNPQDFVYAIRDQIAPAVVRPDTDGQVVQNVTLDDLLRQAGAPVSTEGQFSYKLDDNGTVAALAGWRYMPATAPEYLSCSVTFDATLTTRLASPTLANALGSQAMPVAAGPWHAEMCLTSQPSGAPAQFGDFALLAIPSNGGVFVSAAARQIAISNQSGTPKVSATGVSDHSITSSLTGYRVSIDVSTNGDVTYQCTDGAVGTVVSAFAGYSAVTFFLALVPSAVAIGSTAVFALIDSPADVGLPSVPDAKALNRNVI